MEILRSIFGLTKSNNGFFKSEKQAKFLIPQISKFDGYIGQVSSGYNSCPVFANWDEKGITKIVKSAKSGDVVMFERKQEGILNVLEIKEIKQLERKIKSLEKDITRHKTSFEDGSYNGSGDVNTYTPDMIELYNCSQSRRIDQVQRIRERISKLKK